MSHLRLSYIDEDEGTPDTWGWYVVDEEGGALCGPFTIKDEAFAEIETLKKPKRHMRAIDNDVNDLAAKTAKEMGYYPEGRMAAAIARVIMRDRSERRSNPETDEVVPVARLREELERVKQENAALREERHLADNALVDRYRDPKTGSFVFPTDVAAIVRRLDAAEAERDVLKAKAEGHPD